MKPSYGLITVLEPERDRLFKVNQGILTRIQMFEEIIHNSKQRYNENQEKIQQLDYLLDTYAYLPEEETAADNYDPDIANL